MLYLFQNFRALMGRHAAASLLNIFGMGVAFAAVYLIAVQVGYDLSFNRRVPHADRICRLEHPSWTKEEGRFARWNRVMPQQLCEAFPEIEASGSIGFDAAERPFSVKRRHAIDNFTLRLAEGERAGFDVFAFELLDGSFDALRTTDDLLLSAAAATRLGLKAGDRIHAGAGAEGERLLTVAAVYRDFAAPSAFDALDGFRLLPPLRRRADGVQSNPHGSWSYPFYLRLAPAADPAAVGERMAGWLREQFGKEGMSEEEIDGQMKLLRPIPEPFAKLYFAEDTEAGDQPQGNRTTTRILLAIAVLILTLAVINFVNFFFALIPIRIRAINTCKIFGASQWQLRCGLSAETLGLVAASGGVAAALLLLVADTPIVDLLSTSISPFENGRVVMAMLLAGIAIAVATGLFPAWYLTRFPPAFVLKGSFRATAAGRRLRDVLVGVQYVIALVLIVAALFLHRQHRFMMRYEMGFDREQLYGVHVPQRTLPDGERLEALFARFKQRPEVADVAAAGGNLVDPQPDGWGYIDAETGRMNLFSTMRVSSNFLSVMGIDLTEGRAFTKADEQGEGEYFICNETARREFGLPLDLQIPRSSGAPTVVVGFCEDFHFRPMQYAIEPFAFIVQHRTREAPNYLYIRMRAGVGSERARACIRETLAAFDGSIEPERLEPRFIDEELEANYRHERRLSTLVLLFSLLAVLLSVMGVFGLVLFETQHRRREIGIRRVHGATVGEILAMFNRRYLAIVLACSIVALPIGYRAVDRWLSSFAYRTPMTWELFALAVLLVAGITVATVTARSWRAAHENPSDVVSGN